MGNEDNAVSRVSAALMWIGGYFSADIARGRRLGDEPVCGGLGLVEDSGISYPAISVIADESTCRKWQWEANTALDPEFPKYPPGHEQGIVGETGLGGWLFQLDQHASRELLEKLLSGTYLSLPAALYLNDCLTGAIEPRRG